MDGFRLISDPWLNGRLGAHACSTCGLRRSGHGSQTVITFQKPPETQEMLLAGPGGIRSYLELQGAQLIESHPGIPR